MKILRAIKAAFGRFFYGRNTCCDKCNGQVNITVNTSDAATFARSQSQILNDIKRGLGRA